MITKGNHTEQKTHHTLEFLRMIGARYGGKFDRDTIETEITGIAINCGAGRKLHHTGHANGFTNKLSALNLCHIGYIKDTDLYYLEQNDSPYPST